MDVKFVMGIFGRIDTFVKVSILYLYLFSSILPITNKRVKHFGLWKNKIINPMTMLKKGQSATLALLTYELFLTIGPNCMVSIDIKAKWDH